MGINKNFEKRKIYESKVIETMIYIYCKKNHNSKSLCSNCKELVEYCNKRIEHCPLGDAKINCQQCEIHCYSSEQRERIREIMRFSGPRMTYLHPIMAIKHLLSK